MTTHLRSSALTTDPDLTPVSATVDVPGGLYRSFGKRAFDLLLVALLAIPAILIIAPLAFLVARDGASPFYRQERLGLDGKRFWIWKLRSMVVDADRKLEAYLAENPEAKAEWDLTQKLRNDPRITPIGRLIRKTSLDELPQLFNIFKGEMSLVGPRPMMVDQRALYPGTAYYALRPGITGYWQVSARNESSFAERATFDTDYYKDLSLRADLWTLMQTVRVVMKATGH